MLIETGWTRMEFRLTNLAMLNALELALSLVQYGDFEASIHAYEQKKYEYSFIMAEMSEDSLKRFFGDNGAKRVRDWIS